MAGELVSRRTFLKIAAIGGVASVGSGLPVDGEAEAHGRRHHGRKKEHRGDRHKHRHQRHERSKSKLERAIEQVLGSGVQGTERNNRIAGRLATNLALIGGPTRDITDQRRKLLLKAAGDVEKHQQKRSLDERRTVTQNLNDLLDAIRAQRAAPGFKASLLNAVNVSVLFATHGSHFEDTSKTHSAFRLALLRLKDRRSEESIASRAAAKRAALAVYRATIAARRRQLTLEGHFPGQATIRSVWIMLRSTEV